MIMILHHQHHRSYLVSCTEKVLAGRQAHIHKLLVHIRGREFKNPANGIQPGRHHTVITLPVKHQRIAHLNVQVFSQVNGHQHAIIVLMKIASFDHPFFQAGYLIFFLRVNADDGRTFGKVPGRCQRKIFKTGCENSDFRFIIDDGFQ